MLNFRKLTSISQKVNKDDVVVKFVITYQEINPMI